MFEDNRLYSDAQISLAFSVCDNTIPNWRKRFGFPSGDLYGRLRRTTGGTSTPGWPIAPPRRRS